MARHPDKLLPYHDRDNPFAGCRMGTGRRAVEEKRCSDALLRTGRCSMSAPMTQKPKAKIETRTDVAIAILRGLDPAGRHDLAAINPHLPKTHPDYIEAATFLTSQRDAAIAWIEARQGIKNIYTSVNRAAATAP